MHKNTQPLAGSIDNTDTVNESPIELLIQLLERSLPEFQMPLDNLIYNCEDDLSIHLIMSELANFVLKSLEESNESTSMLQHCFKIIEALAGSNFDIDNQADIIPAIRWAFLDELPPQTVQMVMKYMGEATKKILESEELDEWE
ncbi:MAG: hypothetical protein M1483_00360 [Actinobacteria bacterium]|nr:hypothetical protein [Actinomycetota bacterium]MCL6104088.1 hypothetical protein [Actinomycetota bacterium]